MNPQSQTNVADPAHGSEAPSAGADELHRSRSDDGNEVDFAKERENIERMRKKLYARRGSIAMEKLADLRRALDYGPAASQEPCPHIIPQAEATPSDAPGSLLGEIKAAAVKPNVETKPHEEPAEAFESRYPPIENHALIGNMRTAAVITMHGTIDFYCYPHFDSPAVFCCLLDRHKGGYWGIHPVLAAVEKGEALRPGLNVRDKQYYWPETNILVTRFLSAHGAGQIVDFMPVARKDEPAVPNCIVRKVKGASVYH